MKIFHVDRNVVTNTTTRLELICGETYGYRGEKHDYLRMWLYISSKGEANVSMEDYIKKVINGFLEEIKGASSTLSKENVFKVRDDGTRNLLHRTRK